MPSKEALEAIKEWFSEGIGADVSEIEVPRRRVTIFRAESDSPHGDPELEVSHEAFADHTAEEIISDLELNDVLTVFKSDPTMRLTFTSDRQVPHFERLKIRVDGRQYRIVRDTQHNVRIFDGEDQLLENFPEDLTVMQTSIFRRDRQRWKEDIRRWRGEDQ